MKVRLPLAILFLVTLGAARAEGEVRVQEEKVAEGVWAAPTPGGANVGWFVLADGVVAVDSGGSAEVARAVLDRIRATAARPVRYLIVTHAHADHAGGAAVFAAAGAQIVCAEAAASGVVAVLQAGSNPGQASGVPDTSAMRAAARRGVLTVSERLIFVGGVRRAEVYYLGAAHTRGDLVVVLPEEGVLFSGDVAVNGVLPFLRAADVDPSGWERLLPRLAALKLEKMAPGHGAIGPLQGIADTLAYVRRVNELARRLVDGQAPEHGLEKYVAAPENRIENVRVTPEHIGNVRAVYLLEKARQAAASAPTAVPPGAAPTATPPSR